MDTLISKIIFLNYRTPSSTFTNTYFAVLELTTGIQDVTMHIGQGAMDAKEFHPQLSIDVYTTLDRTRTTSQLVIEPNLPVEGSLKRYIFQSQGHYVT